MPLVPQVGYSFPLQSPSHCSLVSRSELILTGILVLAQTLTNSCIDVALLMLLGRMSARAFPVEMTYQIGIGVGGPADRLLAHVSEELLMQPITQQ